MDNFLLLGDSGYEFTNCLLSSCNCCKILYESQIRTRNTVQRSYGVWKRRFPVLALGMRLSNDRTKTVVTATAILHNLAIKY